jgi:hypothetical protein
VGTKDESLTLAGRAHDGWKLAVGLKSGEVLQLGDYDRPEIVWSRCKTAGKGEMIFTGCRTEAGGTLDGWAAFSCAEEIRYVRNMGPAVAGAGSVEARILAIEEAMAQFAAGLNEVTEDFNDLTTELEEKKVIEPEPEEGAEPGAPVTEATAEKLQATAVHSDEE